MGDSSLIVVEQEGVFYSSFLATGSKEEIHRVLRARYNTQERAFLLVSLGDIFCLGDNPAVGAWPEFCNTLTSWQPPRVHTTMESVWQNAKDNWCDKVYWCRKGKWKWCWLLGRRDSSYISSFFKPVRKPNRAF